jgi:hypothetical protein
MEKKYEYSYVGYIIVIFLILTNFKGVDISQLDNKTYLQSCIKVAGNVIKEQSNEIIKDVLKCLN